MAFPAFVSDCFVIDDSLYEMPSSLLKYFISGAGNFSWTSAVYVKVSQAYKSTRKPESASV